VPQRELPPRRDREEEPVNASLGIAIAILVLVALIFLKVFAII
jgi:hypothetical protein